MWTCPDCNRTFKNTHQDHSCLLTDIESHFVGKQENVKLIFNEIMSFINTLENVTLNSVKNAILFTNNTHFLAIKPKKEFLDIEFILEEKIDEFPIHKTVQTTKTKWAHFVRLGSVEEADIQLLNWLKNAYKISI